MYLLASEKKGKIIEIENGIISNITREVVKLIC